MRITFSAHAVQRYQERVKPDLTTAEALADLRRVEGAGITELTPPAWLHTPDRAELYLLLGDLCFPLRDIGNERYVAVTCFARGVPSTEARRYRTERKRRRRLGHRGERVA